MLAANNEDEKLRFRYFGLRQQCYLGISQAVSEKSSGSTQKQINQLHAAYKIACMHACMHQRIYFAKVKPSCAACACILHGSFRPARAHWLSLVPLCQRIV